MAKTTLIPIEMCFEALKSKKTRALQVYIWLKMHCSGKIKITPVVLKEMQKEFGLKSTKRLKANITLLEEKKWISFSKRSGYHFILSYEAVCRMENYQIFTSAEIGLDEFRNFKSFCIGAAIAYLTKKQMERLIAIELEKGNSKKIGIRRSFFPVANEALAKIFDISISTAYEWKKLAHKKGFIRKRRVFKRLKDVRPQDLNLIKKYGIDTQRVRIRKGKVVEQMPDLIASNVFLRRRKKMLYRNLE